MQTPGLGLRLVNLPGYSPDFNADEAVWGWAREEATGNLCLGTKALVQERVGELPPRAVQPKDEVKRRCRTVLQSRAETLRRDIQTLSSPRQMHIPPWLWFSTFACARRRPPVPSTSTPAATARRMIHRKLRSLRPSLAHRCLAQMSRQLSKNHYLPVCPLLMWWRTALPSVVHIIADSGTGTGFIINEDGSWSLTSTSSRGTTKLPFGLYSACNWGRIPWQRDPKTS